jgi:peroxiredoxin
MKRPPSLPFLLSITIVLLLSFSLQVFAKEETLFSRIGIQLISIKRKAPDYCLEGLKGEKVQLKNFKGKVVFLNFWATWCGPCKEEMPSMNALHQQFKDKGFVFLTISVDYEGKERVTKFMEKHRYDFKVLLDPSGKTLSLFEINRIPATIIIDKEGRIIGKVIGPRDWGCSDVLALIDQLLNKPSQRIVSLRD